MAMLVTTAFREERGMIFSSLGMAMTTSGAATKTMTSMVIVDRSLVMTSFGEMLITTISMVALTLIMVMED
jgi:hypothetical protein